MNYSVMIGLEVHLELSTETKAFCGCPIGFGAPPNSQVCPVCLGLPGALPVINERAVEFAIRAGLALNCSIAANSHFDRKNYFYPDLAKGYQISQYQQPLAEDGYVLVPVDDGTVRVGIIRVHLEEDTGKLTHIEDGATLVDFNRSGVPLLEIVSHPDIRSPEEARLYLQELRTILLYTGISDLKMEEGSLRCDANVSLRPGEDAEPGVLVEVKNMNSFRSVKMALDHEVERQAEVLSAGGRVTRETRHWDEQRQLTFSSRSKEQAHDYRYFPEPDLPPLVIDQDQIEQIRATLPELPEQRRQRLITEHGLPKYDAEVLTASLRLAQYFDQALELFPDAKMVSNWVMGDLLGCLNALRIDIGASPVSPRDLAELLQMIDRGTISGKIAKTVLEDMCRTGDSASTVVSRQGLEQISDQDELGALVDRVIADNPGPAADYRQGKERALAFLVGQVMKLTRGRANPRVVNELLRTRLGQ